MKPTDRLFAIARWLGGVVVLLGGWLIYELVNDPYEDVNGPPERGAGTGLLTVAPLPAELDYERIQKEIEDNQRLWEPLVKKPKAAPKKVSLKDKIKGLKVLAVISEGDRVKFIIKDPANNTEKIYQKGDKVRDLTLSSFTYSHIILSFGGETIKLSFL